MGHASVTITYDRYRHLMPGNEEEAAARLDAYLERANTRARLEGSTTGRRAPYDAARRTPNYACSHGTFVRQSFASRDRNQWTSTDFVGL